MNNAWSRAACIIAGRRVQLHPPQVLECWGVKEEEEEEEEEINK